MHDRWRHQRNEQQWERQQRNEYDRRRDNKALRPPRTYREMQSRVSRMPASQRRNFEMAEPMTRVVASKTTAFRFERIQPKARQQISRQSSDVRKFTQERSHWESQGPGRKGTASQAMPKGAQMKPSGRMGSAPAEATRRGETPGSGREGATHSQGKQMSAKVSSREAQRTQPDKVKVRTRPVAGEQGKRLSGKKPPSRPEGEYKEKP
jgi:hypothetical protein